MLFSLVIAAFNIEGFIEECLESCLNQLNISQDEYEIIVVNDGSTDGTLIKIEAIAKTHKNIKIVTRQNGGLSAARNTGLETALGEYVWFIDGDDKISSDALMTIKNLLIRNKDTCFIINYSEFYEKNNYEENKIKFNLPDNLIPQQWMKKASFLPMMTWLTIYNRKFLIKNGLKFTEGIIHEDYDFSFRSHVLAQSCVHIKKELYLYRKNRDGSIMNSPDRRKKNILSLITIEKVWKNFIEDYKIDNSISRRALANVSLDIIKKRNYSNYLKTLNASKYDYYKNIWHSSSKFKIKLILLLFFPRIFVSKIFKLG